MKAVVIQGSARSLGNTRQLIGYLKSKFQFDIIDLKDYTINHYDYTFKNQKDDFKPLVAHIIKNYDLLIFATPIYWYSMSGIMKVFFDRISDLLTLDKALARTLNNKHFAVISCGSDCEVKKGFYMPFIESANYLDMHYQASTHGWIEDGKIAIAAKQNLDKFANQLVLKLDLT